MASHQTEAVPSLAIPTSLQEKGTEPLPHLSVETMQELAVAGWKRVGIMVAVLDSSGCILMLEHNARKKNPQGVLGPMGETAQEIDSPGSDPQIESLLGTLYRGLREELVIERPERLGLSIHRSGGWAVNQWPRGTDHPGEYSCAISFPIVASDTARETVLEVSHAGREVGAGHFMQPDDILALDDNDLRPGVKHWLRQLGDLGLLDPNPANDSFVPINFAGIGVATDIDLGRYLPNA